MSVDIFRCHSWEWEGLCTQWVEARAAYYTSYNHRTGSMRIQLEGQSKQQTPSGDSRLQHLSFIWGERGESIAQEPSSVGGREPWQKATDETPASFQGGLASVPSFHGLSHCLPALCHPPAPKLFTSLRNHSWVISLWNVLDFGQNAFLGQKIQIRKNKSTDKPFPLPICSPRNWLCEVAAQ